MRIIARMLLLLLGVGIRAASCASLAIILRGWDFTNLAYGTFEFALALDTSTSLGELLEERALGVVGE